MYRQLNSAQRDVMITVLLMANHESNEWEFKGELYKVRPGQFVTSLENLKENCATDVSIQKIRTALKKLEMHGFLTNESTNKNRLITVVNWAFYQDGEDKLTSSLTDNQQATNKQLTTNKNDKNVKNEKNIYEAIISYLNQKANKKFSHKSAANQKLINGRISEGRNIDDFKKVIDVKVNHWLDDPKMNEYLRPSTLFAQKNFENYLNQKPKDQQKQHDPRDKEIALQQWIQEGKDPDEFDWTS